MCGDIMQLVYAKSFAISWYKFYNGGDEFYVNLIVSKFYYGDEFYVNFIMSKSYSL